MKLFKNFIIPVSIVLMAMITFKILSYYFIFQTTDSLPKGLYIIEEAVESGYLKLAEREKIWITRIKEQIDEIPRDEGQFIAQMKESAGNTAWIPEEYGI